MVHAPLIFQNAKLNIMKMIGTTARRINFHVKYLSYYGSPCPLGKRQSKVSMVLHGWDTGRVKSKNCCSDSGQLKPKVAIKRIY